MSNILDNINKYVADELAKETIPSDAKYVVIGTVDNNGAKILAAVDILEHERFKTKVAAVWHHNWNGDDTVAAKVIFTGK